MAERKCKKCGHNDYSEEDEACTALVGYPCEYCQPECGCKCVFGCLGCDRPDCTDCNLARRWITCAECGQKRSMETLESRDTFVCRYCLSTEAERE